MQDWFYALEREVFMHPTSGGYVYTTSSDCRQQTRSCGCVGPQNGQPKCPCKMQNMRQVNGRWVETIDHGPVRSVQELESAFEYFEDFMKYEMTR